MGNKFKKTIVFIAVVLAVIICIDFGFRLLLHVKAESREKRGEEIKLIGPWAEQAIWISDTENLYLICEKDADVQYASVTAYIQTNGEWISYSLIIPFGPDTVTFEDQSTGDTVFSAKFKIKDRDNLTLFALPENLRALASSNDNSITLARFSYSERINTLPFQTE